MKKSKANTKNKFCFLLFTFFLSPLLTDCSSITPFNYTQEAELWEEYRLTAYQSLKNQKDEESIKLFEKALKQAEKFGKNDARVATSLQELADLYLAKQNYSEANKLYIRSASIYEQLWNETEAQDKSMSGRGQDLASVLDKQASCCEQQGEFKMAEECYKKAIKIARLDVSPARLYKKLVTNYKNFLTQQNRKEEAQQLLDQLEKMAPIQTFKTIEKY